MTKQLITIETEIEEPMELVWELWNNQDDIVNWYFASEDLESSSARNDLVPGGQFSYHLNAKDKSFGFDFAGVYEEVNEREHIKYKLGDDRISNIYFVDKGDSVHIKQEFEAESQNDPEMQRAGWQARLNNFKGYADGK